MAEVETTPMMDDTLGAPAPVETPEEPARAIDDEPRLNVDETEVITNGTILEAAFVDPAYSWPPKDGEGANAVELEATPALMEEDEMTTAEEREAMKMPEKPVKKKGWACCRSNEAVVTYEKQKTAALVARKQHAAKKKAALRNARKKNRFGRVPEGILIYRLDTSNHTIELMSQPHANTDEATLLKEMEVASAKPAIDPTRRAINLVGTDGSEATLMACEQRTAIAWMESIDMMLGNKQRMGDKVSTEAESDGVVVGWIVSYWLVLSMGLYLT